MHKEGMYGYRARIGYTSPPTVTEVFPYEFYRMAPEGVTLIITTLAVLEFNAAEVNQSRDIALKAAKDMARSGADVVVLGGVPINISLGVEKVQALMRKTAEDCGVPVTSSVEAQTDALKAVGAKRLGVVQPFDEAHSGMYSYLEDFGFELCGVVAGGYEAISLGGVPKEAAVRLSRQLLREQPDIDTIQFPCPHWPVSEVVDELEQELKVNVVGACQAITWKALRLAGLTDAISGYGRLFRDF